MNRERKFDPITLDILWRRLISIVDEADAAVYRTSFSSLIRDAHDYTNAFFDRHGRELCEGSMVTPGQLGALSLGVKSICTRYPEEAFRPGDILVSNDPWLLAGHLNDVGVISPIFFKGRLAGFTACVFHHTDIGGRHGADNREVYEEGVFIPLMKLCDAGVMNESLLQMLRANVRKPDDVIGDLRSQIAANHVCAQKVVEMMEETGLESLDELADEIIGRTERSMRQAVEAIPDGDYRYEGVIEGQGKRADIKIRLAVHVSGSDVTVDFAGTDPQVGWGVNTVYNFTYSYVNFAFKSALNPEIPNNYGSTLAVKVKAPEGSVVNCTYPAAVAHRTHVGHALTEMVYLALAEALPERVLAECGRAAGNTVVYGTRHNGERFLAMDLRAMGMGASYRSDGVHCFHFPSNASNTPCEILEGDTPFIVEKRAILDDTGGAGRHRGGLGQEIVWRIPDDEYAPRPPVTVVNVMGRFRYAAKGLFGGREGAKSIYQINGVDSDWGGQNLCKPGDVIRFCTPGGGGYGDPLERDEAAVRIDVLNGYVSAARAQSEYGVVIDPKTGEIDGEATRRLRERLKRPAAK
ncbi:MAG TPA: hydantoinase B/oxoprolinase family protein [Burkholderiales bacterium]|nr:hydantoinase B/oxoprolinase family protein [Burkholderiales bacterium]